MDDQPEPKPAVQQEDLHRLLEVMVRQETRLRRERERKAERQRSVAQARHAERSDGDAT